MTPFIAATNTTHQEDYRLNVQRRELVIIDPSVPDYQTLLSGISTNTEVHILDKDRDGITQITEILTKTQETQQSRTQQCRVPTETGQSNSKTPSQNAVNSEDLLAPLTPLTKGVGGI